MAKKTAKKASKKTTDTAPRASTVRELAKAEEIRDAIAVLKRHKVITDSQANAMMSKTAKKVAKLVECGLMPAKKKRSRK